jgi:membrane-associated phospholipid phosphatase
MMPTNPLRSAVQTTRRPMRRFARSADAVIVVLLVLTVVATVPDNRRMGSALQVILPLVALGCAATRGKTVEILGQFVVLQAGVKGSKHLLGESPVSLRPDGGTRGFPSGHTAVATFGAVQMIKHCAALHPVTNAAAIAAAAFTGGSRIEAQPVASHGGGRLGLGDRLPSPGRVAGRRPLDKPGPGPPCLIRI